MRNEAGRLAGETAETRSGLGNRRKQSRVRETHDSDGQGSKEKKKKDKNCMDFALSSSEIENVSVQGSFAPPKPLPSS